MAYRDAAGSATIGGVTGSAALLVGAQGITPYSPTSGSRIQTLALFLSIFVGRTDGLNSDIEWQVATDAAFSNVVWSTSLSNQPAGQKSVITSTMVDKTTYYWRARASLTGAGTWTAWTPTRTVTPDLNTGRGYAYIHENVGVTVSPEPDVTSVQPVHENVGVLLTLDRDVTSVQPVHLNVGFRLYPDPDAVQYVHEGDVNTLPPTPHIWFLSPAAGRSGDGIRIFCFGVGDLVSTYAGSVQLYYGSVLGWVTVPVVSWQTFPPGPNAYTAARMLDPETGYIDMQHSVVEIVVPDGALPPGYPLRIRTVTP
jgi:hypothetical protein